MFLNVSFFFSLSAIQLSLQEAESSKVQYNALQYMCSAVCVQFEIHKVVNFFHFYSLIIYRTILHMFFLKEEFICDFCLKNCRFLYSNPLECLR